MKYLTLSVLSSRIKCDFMLYGFKNEIMAKEGSHGPD